MFWDFETGSIILGYVRLSDGNALLSTWAITPCGSQGKVANEATAFIHRRDLPFGLTRSDC